MLCRNHIDVSEGIRRCARCGATFCQNCLVDIAGKPFCATCKTEQILDVRSGVETGVLDFAGIGRRFLAELIDGFLIAIPMILILLAAGVFTNPSRVGGGWNILFMAVAVTYRATMLAARGQTVGKMAVKVKVVSADGFDLTTGQAWGREVMRVILGLLCIVDYLPAFFTDEKTTLHDLVAKTRVVNWS
jgi:uncharacterized RDD family membrane protein YckC